MAERNDLTDTFREATYVAIGLGVLGFQRAQVRRRELAKQLETQRPELAAQLAEVRAQVTELGRDLERRLEPALAEAGERMEPLLQQLKAKLAASGRQNDA